MSEETNIPLRIQTVRDEVPTNVNVARVLKIPRYRGFGDMPQLGQVNNWPGMEGNVILDRLTGDLCWHDGLQWRCASSAGIVSNLASTTCVAPVVTPSVDLVFNGVGPNLVIKRLQEGDGIMLTDTANDCVQIEATGDNITLTDGACTESLIVTGTGPNLVIKGLEAGPGITLNDDGTCITIGVQ